MAAVGTTTGEFLREIKFSHSVFALPFALIAMLLAAGGFPGWWVLFWIVVACVGARTAAMCFNRLADVDYDRRNPRTRGRALAAGRLSRGFMIQRLLIASLVFFLAAAMLNPTCLVLAPPTLGILFFYSLTKRFTSLAHFFLGLALGLAPLGAWIAVRETVELLPVLLSLAVMCWVAGFDMLYACQDAEVDAREEELHSIPKALGIAGALSVARRVHLAAFLLFVLFWWNSELGFLSFLGILAAGVMLVYQHSLVSPRDLSRVDAAFFTSNGLLSIGLFLIVFLDIVLI